MSGKSQCGQGLMQETQENVHVGMMEDFWHGSLIPTRYGSGYCDGQLCCLCIKPRIDRKENKGQQA